MPRARIACEGWYWPLDAARYGRVSGHSEGALQALTRGRRVQEAAVVRGAPAAYRARCARLVAALRANYLRHERDRDRAVAASIERYHRRQRERSY